MLLTVRSSRSVRRRRDLRSRVGPTTVSCTATDPHDNSANGSFVVTITDHTAPSLTVPADITTEATGAATAVTFTATGVGPGRRTDPASCTPASGSAFPLGDHDGHLHRDRLTRQ